VRARRAFAKSARDLLDDHAVHDVLTRQGTGG